mmetsp:Transcript_90683/g.143344  ORF Transcript_90683/g.143344 Transcript_90683/m.143344 type:complete len:232 (-) Transcript_90683:159-854(-)
MAAPTAALIFMHGSGDNGQGVKAWLDSVSRGEFSRRLQDAKIKLVCPDSPVIPYTLAGGMRQSVWFNRVAMKYEAPEDKEGITRSIAQIDAEIDKLIASGIPVNRIGVGGMSMGGCMALHVGYGAGKHAGSLGMVAALSTFLPEDSSLDSQAFDRFGEGKSPAPPLFQAHGSADAMISPQWAHSTRSRLEVAGVPAPPEVAMYPGVGHDMCHAELEELRTFVIKNLGSSES